MKIKISPFAFFSCLILLIAYFTYFKDYWYPPALFWDENYHITSAYKYLNHVMFMEPHPPLGKLFIALGDYLLQPNLGKSMEYALKTDYISSIPAGFSFVGVRFFPTLFGTLSSLIFFAILYKIMKRAMIAFAFSFLYLCENALILQSRSAMLESTQIFFLLSALLWFLHLLEKKIIIFRHYFFLGLLIGAAVAVKLNGNVLFLLLPFLLYHEKVVLKKQQTLMSFAGKTTLLVLGALIVFFFSYYVHALLGTRVLNNNYYLASDAYKQVLQEKKTDDLDTFPIILADNLSYIPHYEKGVPKYDPTKKDENGSLPYTWAFGNKSINYRWETNNGLTRYLYLQGNPVVWLFGLIGLVLGSCLVLAVLVFKLPVKDKKLFFLIVVFLSLYVGYMVPILLISRVLYLYLYLVPLLFSLFLGCTIFFYINKRAIAQEDTNILFGIATFIILVISSYMFFSPLTYYQPLTVAEFMQRNWFPFWHLKPVL